MMMMMMTRRRRRKRIEKKMRIPTVFAFALAWHFVIQRQKSVIS